MRILHVTLSSVRGEIMFADEQSVRRAVRSLARVTGPELVLFRVAPDRADAVLVERDGTGGRAATSCWRTLRAASAAPTEPLLQRPVERRSHLLWCLAHLLEPGRALDGGGCFADLVGARVVPGFQPARLRRLLPRVREADLCARVGLSRPALRPASLDEVRAAGARRLVAACAAAACADPALGGSSAPVLLARRLALRVGLDAGIHWTELAWALGCSERTFYRYRDVRTEERLRSAVLLRLGISILPAATSALRRDTREV